ncbi:MAG: radical SAM protein, partial [Deltaproteobacteria bacterium]|nr:radical SAM protein [Deltaproteobacteria bacterium]
MYGHTESLHAVETGRAAGHTIQSKGTYCCHRMLCPDRTGCKHKIPEIVRSSPMENHRRPTLIRRNISSECDFKQAPVTVFGNRTRPFLKIQDGCDTFCTYCIVPYARGRSRSMAPEKVLENIRHLKHAGYQEVVLTGVHLGAYGLDLSPKYHLAGLLSRIYESNPIHRVRLSSIEPH